MIKLKLRAGVGKPIVRFLARHPVATLVPLIIVIGMSVLVLTANGERTLRKNLGIENGKLKDCPNRQNCRSSDDPQERFQIEAIEDAEGRTWALIVEVMASLKKTKLVEEAEDYLHFTQASAFFHFVDDIEFHNRPEAGQIAIRSASRLGYRDFGVNEDRIEEIRTLLQEKTQ